MGRASNERFLARLDGRVGIGRACADDGSHCEVHLALARRTTPTGAAFLATLSRPSIQFLSLIASLPDGTRVRPTTIVVNQSELASSPSTFERFRGPVVHGVAEALAYDEQLGRLSDWLVNEMIVLAAVQPPTPTVDHRLSRDLVRAATERALVLAEETLPFAAVVPDYSR